jgi:predicted transcriptional regulator
MAGLFRRTGVPTSVRMEIKPQWEPGPSIRDCVIVACFVSNNPLAAIEVPALITSTHAGLRCIDAVRVRSNGVQKLAVPIEEPVADNYLICLNDGQKLRAPKRYIYRKYSLSPEQYREKWGLPDDYPMVAPACAELRSKIAKERASGASGRSRPGEQHET